MDMFPTPHDAISDDHPVYAEIQQQLLQMYPIYLYSNMWKGIRIPKPTNH